MDKAGEQGAPEPLDEWVIAWMQKNVPAGIDADYLLTYLSRRMAADWAEASTAEQAREPEVLCKNCGYSKRDHFHESPLSEAEPTLETLGVCPHFKKPHTRPYCEPMHGSDAWKDWRPVGESPAPAREPHDGWLNTWAHENVKEFPVTFFEYLWHNKIRKMAGDWADFRAERVAAPPEPSTPKIYKWNQCPDSCPECDGKTFITSGQQNLVCLHCYDVSVITELEARVSTLEQALRKIPELHHTWVGNDLSHEEVQQRMRTFVSVALSGESRQ